MKFMYTDLGPRQLGEVVEVSLSSVANVRLMDTFEAVILAIKAEGV